MDDFDGANRKITQVYPPACGETVSVGEMGFVGSRSLPTELLLGTIYVRNAPAMKPPARVSRCHGVNIRIDISAIRSSFSLAAEVRAITLKPASAL